ncbi:conserved hypothetical protein [Caulobacter vibrioides CB15]|uniref:DUF4870 domain-containing protein n=1 Tax=Caulobacter vibrioides (strain ATCC 19089 / CIP 103742 / CB 15) TaxID=190650 RepID=Q9AB22_CAUVC|nr:conserved hypothetical protein [Caulobacter vibrioides CB15]ATC27243.1 hypothetical protein CA607_02125 [Caulobacter vibrioides]
MTPPSFASRPDQRDDLDNKTIPGSTVTDPTPDTAVPPTLQDDKALPIAIYALHIGGAVTGGFTCLIAAILAYISRKGAPDWLASHYEFQIRTFWLALLFSLISLLLTAVGIGVVMLVAVGLWVIVRAVVGLSHLLKGQPYPTPKNWML